MSNLASDIIYLVNTDAGNSLMAWYDNQKLSTNGEQPDQVQAITSPGAGEVIWEGNYITSNLFLPFTSHVRADAATIPTFSQVGTGDFTRPSVGGAVAGATGQAIYNIFKDNGRVLYKDPVLGNLYSIYFCTDSGQII